MLARAGSGFPVGVIESRPRIYREGNAWCCEGPNFVDAVTSPFGCGETLQEAYDHWQKLAAKTPNQRIPEFHELNLIRVQARSNKGAVTLAPAEITPRGIFAAASALILFLVVCVGLFRGEYKFRVAPVIKRKIQAERQEHPISYRFGMALIIVFALGMAAVAIYELVGPLGPFGLSG